MRVPLSWLAEYVDLPTGSTPEDVHAALVRVGLEEEALHRLEVTGPVVVGEVLGFTPEPQSNGKTIRWCQVRTGPDEVRGIVCGAANFAVGDKVVVTLPGAVLPGPFPIAARTTYGHVSDGMIASSRELGLGEDHEGILVLSTLGLDPAVGTDAITLLGLDDVAIEVNVTPDRGYALSIRGIAREYAHSTGAAFRDPADIGAGARGTGFPVQIIDDAPIRGRVGASVFITRAVRGIDPSRPTPAWMMARLRLAGIRSISLVVDITNYVMLELGQPIHGYDLDRLAGGITVRRALPGETLTTLDDLSRILHTEDLVIADESGAIGLAGIMGGASTEITSETRSVLIEAANFDPVSIARSARRHKLSSEASRRFERGVDPAVAGAAAERVVRLLVELAGGSADPLGSYLYQATPAQPIALPSGFVSGLIGVDYTEDEVNGSLVEIGCTIDAGSKGALQVTPPSWRPDLTDKWTLAEEVARLVGYDRIPSVLPVAPPGRGLTRAQRLRRSAAQVLAANGLTEVQCYPFVSRSELATFSSVGGAVAAIELANPLDATEPFLRRSLLPGLIRTAGRNASRGLTDVALFEIGSVFKPAPGIAYGVESIPPIAKRPSAEVLAELNDGLPPQPRNIAVLITGNSWPKQPGLPASAIGWADALTAVRQLGLALRVRIEVGQATHAG
ncbi:MAG: phenylalanine--tRNA ligase subunit beta, partial [Microbacteriaceae bacterium]